MTCPNHDACEGVFMCAMRKKRRSVLQMVKVDMAGFCSIERDEVKNWRDIVVLEGGKTPSRVLDIYHVLDGRFET